MALGQVGLVGRQILEARANGLELARLAQVPFHLLVDRRVQEEREHRGRRPVDGERHRRGRRTQVEARVELLRVVEGADRDARVSALAVDVRAAIGISAVEGHTVERGRETGHVVAAGQIVEAAVRPLRTSLAREHPRGVLSRPPKREDARRERKCAGDVLAAEETDEVAPVVGARQGHLRKPRAREGLGVVHNRDHAAPHLIGLLGGLVPLPLRGPGGEGLAQLRGQRVEGGTPSRLEAAPGVSVLAELRECAPEGVRDPGPLRQDLRLLPVAAHQLGDLGEVAPPGGRNQCRIDGLGGPALPAILGRPEPLAGSLGQLAAQGLEEPGGAWVVPLAGDGREDRDLVGRRLRRVVVPRPLLADVPECVLRPVAVELVEHHAVCEIEHVDLLELGRRPELRRHHVEGVIDEVDDLRVALTDPRRLDEDQVEAGRLEDRDRVAHGHRECEMRLTRRHRADEDTPVADRVEADAVAEQGTAGPAPGGIDE